MKSQIRRCQFIWSFFAAAAFALALTGCGGGGGGGGGSAANNTALAIVSSNIISNAVSVPTNTKISYTFNKPIQPCSSCITMNQGSYIWTNGAVGVTGVTKVSGSTIEFAPNSGLTPNTQYTVYVTTVSDSSNNFFFGSSSSLATITFTTGAALDLIPPTVSSYTQTYLPNSTLVTPDSSIAVLFSEAMDATSINSTTFSISDPNNNKVSGVVAYSSNVATFTPGALLNPGTTYTATITTGVKDAAGNAMSVNYSWQFSTATASNLSHIVYTSPTNNATGVSTGSYISVRFDQTSSRGTNLNFSVTCSASGATAYNGTTTFDPNWNIANFYPLTSLAANSTCNVVASGMVDSLGKSIPPYSWSFTTAPAPVPVVSPVFSATSTVPASGSTNIKINSAITVGFNGNIGTFPTAAVSTSPPVAGTIIGSGYMNLVFVPASPLASNTTYTVTVSGVTDTAGTLAPNYTSTFTTAPPVAPVVSSTSPASNAPASGVSSPIVATFSKALDPATCTPGILTVSGGVTGAINCNANSISFVPSVPLSLGTSYMATVNTGIKDYEGLSLSNNYSWNFNTRTEYVAPTVIGISHNQSVVNAEFSEAMDPLSINSATFRISPAAAGVVSSSGTGATFTPTSPLAKDTTYTVTISGVKDLAGNTLAADYVWTFLTDPGAVVPFEAYGANCIGTIPFGVYAQNQTPYAQDITICVHNAAVGYASCQTFPNIAPNTYTPYSYLPATNAYVGSVNVCYSSGQYTVSWFETGGSTTLARTDTFTSTTYTPTSPTVDPCTMGGSITSPNCAPHLTISPTLISTTSTTSTTYPSTALTSATSPDADGCYVPQHVPECLVVEKDTVDASNYQVLRLRNNCPQRVYADFCNQHIDGTWDCGADGVAPGGAISWWSYNATGISIYQYTGSTKWMNDWVCADRDTNMSKSFGK